MSVKKRYRIFKVHSFTPVSTCRVPQVELIWKYGTNGHPRIPQFIITHTGGIMNQSNPIIFRYTIQDIKYMKNTPIVGENIHHNVFMVSKTGYVTRSSCHNE